MIAELPLQVGEVVFVQKNVEVRAQISEGVTCLLKQEAGLLIPSAVRRQKPAHFVDIGDLPLPRRLAGEPQGFLCEIPGCLYITVQSGCDARQSIQDPDPEEVVLV